MSTFHCEHAWLGGAAVERDVLVETVAGVITAVHTGSARDPGATPLHGVVVPGLANVHSHAFHRALRASSQTGAGDFWTWRRAMYEVAAALDPESYLQLARATYAEMALAGITAVGEFHYLHHGPGGTAYAGANEMGHALVTAARDAGVRLALIDACYLRSGFDGAPLDPAQERFSDGDVDAWAARFADLAAAYEGATDVVIGAAAHSVRAVDAASIRRVVAAASPARPFHVHVSEQRGENEACVDATGRTPVALLDDAGAISARTVAVHATHLTEDDITRLGRGGAHLCMCPTTERDLGDGIGPARALVDAGAHLSLGSDSHAVIDLFEEARAVELDERLARHVRGVFEPAELLDAATASGHRALGLPGGAIVAGAPADLVAISLDTVRMAGFAPKRGAAHIVFAAAAADVTDVLVAGEWVVRDRVHVRIPDVAGSLRAAIEVVLP